MRPRCPTCLRPVASVEDWARAKANNDTEPPGDAEAPWACALCWGEGEAECIHNAPTSAERERSDNALALVAEAVGVEPCSDGWRLRTVAEVLAMRRREIEAGR